MERVEEALIDRLRIAQRDDLLVESLELLRDIALWRRGREFLKAARNHLL